MFLHHHHHHHHHHTDLATEIEHLESPVPQTDETLLSYKIIIFNLFKIKTVLKKKAFRVNFRDLQSEEVRI